MADGPEQGRHLQRRQVRRRRRQGRAVLPRARLRQGADRPAAAARPRRRAGRQDPLGRAADSGHRGAALPHRRDQFLGQHGREDRRAPAAVQAGAGRVVRREEDPQGLREGARGLRHRRLLRVHRRSRVRVPERPEGSAAAQPAGAAPPPAPSARRALRLRPAAAAATAVGARGDREGRRLAARQRHDAARRRQAVLRQPHHLRRQHDDARQRHPARDAAATRTASSTPKR